MYVFILAGLRFFRWVNWIVAALLTLFFVALLTDAGGLGTSVLAGVEGDLAVRAQVRGYLLGVTGLVLPMALAIDRILTRLAGLVHDARAGTALSEANAAREGLIPGIAHQQRPGGRVVLRHQKRRGSSP